MPDRAHRRPPWAGYKTIVRADVSRTLCICVGDTLAIGFMSGSGSGR